ncbi:MAG: DNA-directed RNA polymerase [Candidatus Hodarchaeota archaeon]
MEKLISPICNRSEIGGRTIYQAVTIKGHVRIPPNRFSEDLYEVAEEILREQYEGIIDIDFGFIIAVIEVLDIGVGKIIPGDGATYHNATLQILTFEPKVNYLMQGEVVEVVDFGAFIRLGPLDGLCHVSQITDDFFSYDPRSAALVGKETGRIITEGDLVRTRIVAVSIDGGARSGKLGLTMRQPYLGKFEWIKEELAKLKESKRKAEKSAKAKTNNT